MAKVLVTDGNNRAALAITRSLGRQGYRVFVGAETQRSLAGASRYCSGRLQYPIPNRSPEKFLASILDFIALKKIDILMPAAETTTIHCMKLKSALEGRCAVPFQSFDTVRRAASKYEVLQLADRLNVPIPKTFFLHAPADVGQAINFCKQSGYPVVVKPSRSRLDHTFGHYSSGAQYAKCAADLERIVRQCTPASFPLLVQERVQGPGVGLFACYNQGTPVAHFSHRRIREKPPSGGVSVLRRSYPVNPELKRFADLLLGALTWHGVAMVEFKRDDRHGGYRLMEINGRFWGSLQLAVDAGVDFPLMLARIAEQKAVPPVLAYDLNVQTRWLWGDIDALLVRLLKRDDKLNLPVGFPNRKRYLTEFLHFDPKIQKLEVLKLRDPGPFILETLRWLGFPGI